MENINYLYLIVDAIIVGLFILCIIKGFKKGFVYQLINILFLFISLAIGYFVSPILSKSIPIFKFSNEDTLLNAILESIKIADLINNVIWFVIIVIGLNLIYLIIKPLFKSFSKMPVIGTFNKILGAFLGIIYAYLIVSLLVIFLSIPFFKEGKAIKDNTILKYTDTVSNLVNNYIIDNIDIENMLNDVENFDTDKARESFKNYLIEQGILNE